MKNRSKIKIIKKGEMKITESSESTEINENTLEEDNASKTTSTVSGWIDEFQNRRREERESAVEQFLS